MLTSDLSTTGWGILALLSGAAVAVATMTLAAKPWHYVIAVLVPVVMALSLWGRAGDLDNTQLLSLYTTICLTLVVLRLVYAPWFTRNLRLRREGKPMTNATTGQSVAFIFVFIATFIGVAFLIL
ncbi:hypothetical protein AQJ23_16395 [Streptomyces antibioticus]|nr:hypothetical protein [Streptomyces antibioticus]KUN25461.1 hypothetical protein AQJ23_16395 [Streptomyces antibioticus]